MENRHHRFRHKNFRGIDRLLVKLATVSIGILLISQTIMLSAETRKYISLVDRLEGEQLTAQVKMYAADTPWPDPDRAMSTVNRMVTKSWHTLRSGKKINIRMINPPASDVAFVTVNGEVLGDFRRGAVKLTVYDGDYLEIDTALVKQPTQFIVDTPKNGLVFPVDGLILESQGAVIIVGKVIIKD